METMIDPELKRRFLIVCETERLSSRALSCSDVARDATVSRDLVGRCTYPPELLIRASAERQRELNSL